MHFNWVYLSCVTILQSPQMTTSLVAADCTTVCTPTTFLEESNINFSTASFGFLCEAPGQGRTIWFLHGDHPLPREGGRRRGHGSEFQQPDPERAVLRERDGVDPVPAGGMRGQRLGILERHHRTDLHVLFSSIHFAVSSLNV